MAFDNFDDEDFAKMIENLFKRLEDLPEPFGDLAKNLKDNISDADPDSLEKMFGGIDFQEFETMIKEMMRKNQLSTEDSLNDPMKFFQLAASPEFMMKMQKFLSKNKGPGEKSNVDPLNFFQLTGNPEFMSKIQEFMSGKGSQIPKKEEFTEPYFEIHYEADNKKGNLIINLPGITDSRSISSNDNEGEINLETINETGIKYKSIIDLKRPIKVNYAMANINNGVYTLPFEAINE